MSYPFNPGDDLIFQLESGFGLLRVLAVEGDGAGTVWHLLAYEELFPDVEMAEAALAQPAVDGLGAHRHTWGAGDGYTIVTWARCSTPPHSATFPVVMSGRRANRNS